MRHVCGSSTRGLLTSPTALWGKPEWNQVRRPMCLMSCCVLHLSFQDGLPLLLVLVSGFACSAPVFSGLGYFLGWCVLQVCMSCDTLAGPVFAPRFCGRGAALGPTLLLVGLTLSLPLCPRLSVGAVPLLGSLSAGPQCPRWL